MPHRARKGKTGGRTMPLHPDLQAALVTLQTARGDMATPARPILGSEQGGRLSPATVADGFLGSLPHGTWTAVRRTRDAAPLRLSRLKLGGPPTPRDTAASNVSAIMHEALGPVCLCSVIGINSIDRKGAGSAGL